MAPFRKCLIVASMIEVPLFVAYLAFTGFRLEGQTPVASVLMSYHDFAVVGAGLLFMIAFGHDHTGPGPAWLWWGLLGFTIFVIQTLLLGVAFRAFLWLWWRLSGHSDRLSCEAAQRSHDTAAAAVSMKAVRIARKMLLANAAAFAATLVLGRGLVLIGAYPRLLGWALADVLALLAVVSVLGMAVSAIAWVLLRTWVWVAKRRTAV